MLGKMRLILDSMKRLEPANKQIYKQWKLAIDSVKTIIECQCQSIEKLNL